MRVLRSSLTVSSIRLTSGIRKVEEFSRCWIFRLELNLFCKGKHERLEGCRKVFRRKIYFFLQAINIHRPVNDRIKMSNKNLRRNEWVLSID